MRDVGDSSVRSGAAAADGTPDTILVVDDDAAVRETLRRGLARAGYTVIVAADGHDGLAQALAAKPAIIVLDLRMPGMDGHTFLRRLASHHVDATVVVASADGDMEDVIEVMRNGAVDYLKKPWTPSELLAVIGRASDIHAQRRHPALTSAIVHPTPAALGAPALPAPPAAASRPSGSSAAFARIREQLQRGEVLIPSVPSVVAELRALVANPDAQIEKVVALIERDQALLTRVLRLGRSSVYSGLGKATDIRSIVSRMGFKELQMLVETVWVNGCFQIRDARYLPYAARLSRFSLTRAVAMRALADQGHLDASMAYLCGLFADVGASFLLWAAVEKAEGHAPLPEESLAFAREQHEAVGAQVLGRWGHDDVVVRIARRHHADAPTIPANPYWNLFVVATAIALEVTGDEDLTTTEQWPKPDLAERCAAGLGITEQARRKATEHLRCELGSVLKLLG